VAERLLAAARRDNPTALSAEALLTMLMTLTLGTLTFEPYLRAATGQDEARWNDTRSELIALAVSTLRLEPASGG
jgi:hypothetical protein